MDYLLFVNLLHDLWNNVLIHTTWTLQISQKWRKSSASVWKGNVIKITIYLNLDSSLLDIKIPRVDEYAPSLFSIDLGCTVRPKSTRVINWLFLHFQVLLQNFKRSQYNQKGPQNERFLTVELVNYINTLKAYFIGLILCACLIPLFQFFASFSNF